VALSSIFKFIIPIALIVLAFMVKFWLGIAAIVVIIAALFYMNRANYYAFQANIANQQGNQEQVLNLLRTATNIANCPPQHHLSYGYMLLRSGHDEQADDVFKQLLTKHLPKGLKMATEMNRALIMWKRGQLDEAIELMEHIYDVYKMTDVYGTLGYLYIERGDAETALSFNQEAYEFNAENGVIKDNLAVAYSMNDQDEQAAELLQSMLDEEPSFPEPYVHYGQLMLKQGNTAEAIQYFEQALERPVHYLSTVSHEEIRRELELAQMNDA